MIRKWFDKKVLILGLSKSGVAAARYLNEKGADCYITEKKALQEKDYELVNELNGLGIKTEFENHSEDFLNDAYIAVTSPGIPPQSEIMQKLKGLPPFVLRQKNAGKKGFFCLRALDFARKPLGRILRF